MDNKKILITGANGMLGQALVTHLLQQTNATIIATGRTSDRSNIGDEERYSYHSLDITDGVVASRFLLEQKPDIIIHAAAMANADECEEYKVDCWNINVTATRFLLDAAKKFNPYLIFLSTDFVFDGLNGPYTEDDITGPVNYYGSSKVAAEKAVIESGLPATIVRTCLVYGDIGKGIRPSILDKVKDHLEANKPIAVSNDQWRTPTYIDDFVKGILLIIQQQPSGIFNISGKELLTVYDMALQVAAHYKLDDSLIEEASHSNFSTVALRPAKAGLIIDKSETHLGFAALSFTEALKKMK